MAHCSLDHSSVALHLEKRFPLSSQRCLPSDCPDLQKKVFSSGRAIFALISDKSASECPIFVNSPVEISITELRLFWTKQPIFRIAPWPTAKSPMAHQWVMAHWLRNPVLSKSSPKPAGQVFQKIALIKEHIENCDGLPSYSNRPVTTCDWSINLEKLISILRFFLQFVKLYQHLGMTAIW